ncbi:MAG: hypothetical protein MHPSP_001727, partial [Paramarteilia canceri]
MVQAHNLNCLERWIFEYTSNTLSEFKKRYLSQIDISRLFFKFCKCESDCSCIQQIKITPPENAPQRNHYVYIEQVNNEPIFRPESDDYKNLLRAYDSKFYIRVIFSRDCFEKIQQSQSIASVEIEELKSGHFIIKKYSLVHISCQSNSELVLYIEEAMLFFHQWLDNKYSIN